jgi:hypothetical protein
MNRLFALLLLAAGTLSGGAQPFITGITPSSGPAGGGTVVTIEGIWFSTSTCRTCVPALGPRVYFGGTDVIAELVDANTIRVVTPAHLPGRVRITVAQHDGSTRTGPDAFTFTGTIEDAFDRVLLPLFIHPVPGQFGSLFVTELRLANSSNDSEATLFGLTPVCPVTCLFDDPLEQSYRIEPSGSHQNEFDTTGTPGAFVYIPKAAPRINANLRVYDRSRAMLNFGTEIPVVYDRELTSEPFKLLGVPRDPNFRNMLRLYSDAETSVLVSYGDVTQMVTLRAGETLLDPAYAQIPIPAGGGNPVDVTITPSTTAETLPGFKAAKVWAFISVTNNETQLISTITPQR